MKKTKTIAFEVFEDDKILIKNACDIKRQNVASFCRVLILEETFKILSKKPVV